MGPDVASEENGSDPFFRQIAAMALRVAIHANDAVAERHKVNDSYDSAVGSPIPGENNSWDGVLTSIL
jgi:hypothetical protein